MVKSNKKTTDKSTDKSTIKSNKSKKDIKNESKIEDNYTKLIKKDFFNRKIYSTSKFACENLVFNFCQKTFELFLNSLGGQD